MKMTCDKIERLNALNSAYSLSESVDGNEHTLTEYIITDDGVTSLKLDGEWYATNSSTVYTYMTEVSQVFTDDEIHSGVRCVLEKKNSKGGRKFTSIKVLA